MQEHYVKFPFSKPHTTYCQSLSFCGYTGMITQVTQLCSHSSVFLLHWKTNKNQTGNKSCDKGFIKWLSSCLIKTSKEILLLQMDQKEDLCPAFLRHGWISTKLLEHWGRVALLQHWNPHITEDIWDWQIWMRLSEMEVQNEEFQLLIFLLI